MIIRHILLYIILHLCSTIKITDLGISEVSPIIPRTNQVINQISSKFPSISFHYSHSKGNFKKVAKTEEKYDQFGRIVGNTQQSNPIFIKLFNKNLSKGYAIDQLNSPFHLKSNNNNNNNNNNEELELKQLNWWNRSVAESQLKHNTDEEMDMKIEIQKLKKSEMMETSCIFNNKKQKYAIIKENIHFWNLSLESIDFDHDFPDIMHISMINRKCSTDQKSTICCEEITKNLDNDTLVCDNSLQISTKCYKYCIHLENDHFINSTEYPCQEDSSFSKFIDWIQTTIYNKTSVIIFGQNKNAKNPEFRIWAQQILQKLDIALTLNNQNITKAFLEEETNNTETNDTILFNQWNKFSKFNETIIDRELIWQLLKEYQQYDENISNNLIRICITNQNMAQIICTEQYYYNICHYDDSNECNDDIFTAQTSIICRRFKIEDTKVIEITESFCDSLNESIIFWYYQRKASQSTTGIIILQLIRTTVIHSISTTTTTVTQLDQDEKSENVVRKQHNYINHIKMKTDKQLGNKFEKTTKTSISKMSKVAENSAEFSETDDIFATSDSTTMQMFSEIEKRRNFTMPKNLSTTLERIMSIDSNLTNSLEIWQNFDDKIIDVTKNSNNTDKINATVEIQKHNINDSTRKAITEKNKINFSKHDKQSLWKPFHMDCSIEKDEFNSTNCNSWAAAGYCLSNNATRFLWCRKTCLCVGPQQL